MRRAARKDEAQDEIVEGLRAAGYRVEIIGRPVDLLCGKAWSYGNKDGSRTYVERFRWELIEVKTMTAAGKRRVRGDQEAQDAFIRETGTPVVMSLEQALKALEGL